MSTELAGIQQMQKDWELYVVCLLEHKPKSSVDEASMGLIYSAVMSRHLFIFCLPVRGPCSTVWLQLTLECCLHCSGRMHRDAWWEREVLTPNQAYWWFVFYRWLLSHLVAGTFSVIHISKVTVLHLLRLEECFIWCFAASWRKLAERR